MDRLTSAFIETYKNDSFINHYELKKGSPFGHRYIARFSFAPRFITESKLICDIIKALFPFIYIPAVSFFFVFSFFKVLFSKKETIKETKIFLLMSGALPKVVRRCGVETSNSAWLVLDGIYAESLNARFIREYNVISIGECFYSYIHALCVLIDTYRFKNGECIFLSLNSFKWFIYYYAAQHIPLNSSVYHCNQKDRWSLLADILGRDDINLLQHGTELLVHPSMVVPGFLKLVPDANSWVMNMPHKLTSVSKVYAFTDREGVAMLSSILDCSPIFCYSGYGLSLTHFDSNSPKVLIISYSSIYLDKEEEIIDKLSKLRVSIIVKNHPTQPPELFDTIRSEYNIIFINEMVFPDADIVVSYDSTLALEYQSLGIEVTYHTDKSVDELINSIRVKLSL